MTSSSASSSTPPRAPQDAEHLIEDVARRLRARGERMTAPRRAVLRALAARPGHLAAEDIVEDVAQLDPGVHRASVYRTLEAFAELGVVQHVHLGHGATAYHLIADPRGHLHVHCTGCGQVQDVPVEVLQDAAATLLRRYGFTLDPTHVALSGACADCRRHG